MTPDRKAQPGKKNQPRTVTAPRPTIGLVDAARAFPKLVIIPIVACLILAVVIGFLRPATYTAQARLAVGRINVATIAAPGVVSASQSLASAYSRAISADAVSKEIETKLGEKGETSASPIPESPVILIEGKAGTEAKAIALANAASHALIKYINELNSTKVETEQLLTEYEEVSREVAKLKESTLPVDEGKMSALELRLHSIESAYRQNLEEETTGNNLRVLTSAQEAPSDRKSVLKLLLIAAIVAGGGLGLLLSYRAANRKPSPSSRRIAG